MPPKKGGKKKAIQAPRRSARVLKKTQKEYEADEEGSEEEVPQEEVPQEEPIPGTIPNTRSTKSRVAALEGDIKNLGTKLDLILSAQLDSSKKSLPKKKPGRPPVKPRDADKENPPPRRSTSRPQ